MACLTSAAKVRGLSLGDEGWGHNITPHPTAHTRTAVQVLYGSHCMLVGDVLNHAWGAGSGLLLAHFHTSVHTPHPTTHTCNALYRCCTDLDASSWTRC